ncbi:DUF5663 domain-containing protein [Nocardia sp. NPDC050710]|uniref:DUF5663 domain-containing protein n=1 Tax=Nocardia sp. NPDC050710 TaxID=3157220 RepID=UPI003408DA35
MFHLDDEFLRRVGLDKMADEDKKAFLTHIYEELELRVGTSLSSGMSDRQLEEFTKIIDGDEPTIVGWLEAYTPQFENDKLFQTMCARTGRAPSDLTLIREYVATKWLEINRPDYREVVAAALSGIEDEIRANRDKLLDEGDDPVGTPA